MTGELSFVHLGFGDDAVPYERAWEIQRAVHDGVADGARPDTCLLLEHPPVYTAGKRTEPFERPADGTPVVDVDRGGKITWHGPGQLVGYPIVRLPDPIDVVAYVRHLEEVMIRVCAGYGVTATRVDGRSGVWLRGDGGPDRKVGAVGIRVARGVTMHGIALNCDCSLDAYDRIVPCGLTDVGTTTLTREAAEQVTPTDVLAGFQSHFADVFGYRDVRLEQAPTDVRVGA